MTNDYSVGLYNDSVKDIYHSAYGALTEAYEKFVLPLNLEKVLENKQNISVLDICYGIGYNSKALLNEYVNYSKKNNASINNIKIDCVDTDELLIKYSPFILSEISFFTQLFYKNKLYKNLKNYDNAKNITQKNKHKKYRLDKIVNVIILNNLLKKYSNEIFTECEKKIFTDNDKKIFFDIPMLRFYEIFIKKQVPELKFKNKTPFVHNIYYENVSKRYKNPLKNYMYTCINMDFHNIDARHFVQNTQQRYDLIFLDGFTPAKCPCLWSEDFIKLLCIHLNDNGILTTYNTSAPVRNALLKAGFFIGNTFDSLNKTIGTIAAKNPALIKNKLSDKYYYLLSTKAGITYKDVTLSLDNDTILLNRLSDIENSNLETSSHYLKRKNYEL